MVTAWRSTRQVPMPLVPSRASLQSAPNHSPARSKIRRSVGAGDAIEDHPAGIGQQHRVAGTGELLVQAVHLAIGDLQDLAQVLAAFQHAVVFEHGGCHGQAGVEVVVLKAAQPGPGDRRIAAGALQSTLALEKTSILQALALCNAGLTAGSPAVPQAVQSVTPSVPKPSQAAPKKPGRTAPDH
ncbi:hypothetical protein L1887_46945 [Cichorium endivia]|nr:hypothetical protein L1887_46945 [Cichorium endivia]